MSFSRLNLFSITIIDKAYIADKLIIMSGIAGPKTIKKGINRINVDRIFFMNVFIFLFIKYYIL